MNSPKVRYFSPGKNKDRVGSPGITKKKHDVKRNNFTPGKKAVENYDESNIEVFNVKITPRMLTSQRFKDAKNKDKSIRGKKPEKFPGKAPIDPKTLEKHSRGEGVGDGVRHPLYAEKLKKKEKQFNFAQEQAARAEILLTEDHGGVQVDGDSKTTSISQSIIKQNVNIAAAAKIFDLDLSFGPYRAKYSRNGRHLLLGSKRGHLAAFDWVTKKLHYEINVMESIHDISWLHSETMMAVAQKEWVYMYDNTGTELHCIKRLDKILRLEFLPYHFLLACVNEFGFMTWLDISVGQIVGHYNNHCGRSAVMAQNPYNASICLGNSKGVVSLWAPTVKEPLAKILCHKTPVTAIAVDDRGLYMATAGTERSLKIWDIRNLDGPLQDYRLRSAPVELAFSQTGMLAVGLDDAAEVYQYCCTTTVDKPYMRHRMGKNISSLKFCPYEDVLGIGTTTGFTSVIIPGSGEPNFDALESNPFQTKTQRREAEVKSLLDKVPAELISLNPFEVTEVDVPSAKEIAEAKSKLMHVKPQNVDFTPRYKNKGLASNTRKKIIKETQRKNFIQKSIEVKKQFEDLNQEQKKTKQSFGVLNRFVAKK